MLHRQVVGILNSVRYVSYAVFLVGVGFCGRQCKAIVYVDLVNIVIYRVANLLASLGWELGMILICAVLPWVDGKLAEQAKQVGKIVENPNPKDYRKIPYQSQPNPCLSGDGPPCTCAV